MRPLSPTERNIVETVQNRLTDRLAESGLYARRRHDFPGYVAIRQAHGDTHLNQAFDPLHVEFFEDDFWLLAENEFGEAIATYCLRRFRVADFFDLIRSLKLWFGLQPSVADGCFKIDCAIPPFGGEIVHGGGLWIRDDHRGSSRLAIAMPHLARAIALLDRPFDHDSAMIRNHPGDPPEMAQRKAVYMGEKVYGFARVHRFVDGWFPPENRSAVMHLCHATRAEAIASLCARRVAGADLPRHELRELPFVYQDYKPVHPAAILGQRQQQARI